MKFSDVDQCSNSYAFQHPIVVIQGFKEDMFFFRHDFGSIHDEIVEIQHLSGISGQKLRGIGYVRPSDLDKEIIFSNDTPRKQQIQAAQAEVYEVI